MRIAVIGRTKMLLDSAMRALELKHEIPLVITSKAEEFYSVTESDFESFAEKIGAEFRCANTLNNDAIQADMKSAKCDLAISMNWPTLINANALNLFPFGIFNAHPGALPRYRGNACPNWAILNGEKSVGLTVHQMEPDLDAGPVFISSELAINERTYIGDIYKWLGEAVPDAFTSLLGKLESGAAHSVPQSEMAVTPLRCYPRRPSDSKINWSNSVEEITRVVRASSKPFSGAYSFLESGEKISIWRAEPYDLLDPFLAIPGQIAGSVEECPIILTGDGAVKLTDLSFENTNDSVSTKLLSKSLRARLI